MLVPVVLSGGFSPRNLPGLQLWLPADRITGLVDGDPVTTWSDLSGSGNNATQGTGAAKPLYKVNIANGRPGVLLDGVDDFMSLTAAVQTALLGANKSVFAVVKWVTLVDDMRVYSVANGGGSTRGALKYSSAPQYQVLYTTGAAQAALSFTSVATPSTTVAQIVELVQAGTAISGRLNGGVGASANDAGAEAANAGALGSNAFASGSFGNLYILEFVAYNVALSTADAARVRRYLGQKYGVVVA